MIIILEFCISEYLSVPRIVKLEVSGIALEISKASPIAFSLVLLSKTISSNEFEAQRNARDDPTKPLPIIEIS